MKGPDPSRKGNRFRPKRRLGQHFIKDPRIIQKIIEKGGFQKTDTVLEIGPGFGALTIPLAGYVREIKAVEKDAQLVRILREDLSKRGITNVGLINGDILRLDLKRAAKGVGEKMSRHLTPFFIPRPIALAKASLAAKRREKAEEGEDLA